MGKRLIALARESDKFDVVAAIERAGHESLNRDAGELAGVGSIDVPVSMELFGSPQVLIDFTTPDSMRHWLDVCRQRQISMLIGTTGLRDDDHAAIDSASREIAVLQATNMSLGVAVLNKLVAQAAKILGDDYDIEVLEAHHRFKRDAPSGTAMSLAEAILHATGKSKDDLVFDRNGDDVPRRRGEIGMHALRIGDEVGKHTVFFAALGERLELAHSATNRDTFVLGALRAAEWLAQQKPGRYKIADVLGV
jgi:4-hydroxy-tetrahydrodipicolinate reductase